MADLHRVGGAPPGWHFTLPPGDVDAGRRAFVNLGCHSCRRVADVISSARDEGRGPDLTGMGSHHPADYFAESIVNPDAVLVDGPGWIGSDGRSAMPAYPELTVRELGDLVAYLKNLRGGGGAEMMMAPTSVAKPIIDVPEPPEAPASIFYVQSYDVRAGQLAGFETWFQGEGASAFLAQDGLVFVETYVDMAHDGPSLVTVLGFKDEAALGRFLDDPVAAMLARKFDDFIGTHQHMIFRRRPLYRSASLSIP